MLNDSPAPTRLERQVGRLAAVVAVLAVGFALAVTWALLPKPEVQASRFELRDARGQRRGALAIDPEGNPTLRLDDARGRAMLYGIVRADGTPRLRLADSTGTSRIVLEMDAGGEPHVQLLDRGGRTGAHAWIDGTGRPVLDVRWRGTRRRVTLPDSSGGRAPRGRDGPIEGRSW